MKYVIAALALVAGFNAKADGFKCQVEGQDLQIKIYNHVNAEDGTRTPAVMVLSDASVSQGRKTIAVLNSDDGLVSTDEYSQIVGKVDLRYKQSSRQGENIDGTKLGDLEKISVQLDFTYAQPVADGADVAGLVMFTKRTGEEWTEKLDCTRYLKN